MKKITLLALVLGAAMAANAQGMKLGVGYDANLGHVTARLGLMENINLDLGLGFNYDNSQVSDAKFQLGLSAFGLLRLQHWGPVSNYVAAGVTFAKLPVANDNIALCLFGGFQPEITLLERLVVATRFGVNLNLVPEFQFQSAGQGISIVNGVNFKIMF